MSADSKYRPEGLKEWLKKARNCPTVKRWAEDGYINDDEITEVAADILLSAVDGVPLNYEKVEHALVRRLQHAMVLRLICSRYWLQIQRLKQCDQDFEDGMVTLSDGLTVTRTALSLASLVISDDAFKEIFDGRIPLDLNRLKQIVNAVLKKEQRFIGRIRRDSRTHDEDAFEMVSEKDDGLSDASQVQTIPELIKNLLRCLSTLDPLCQERVRLRYFESKTITEIAAKLGEPRSTTSDRLKKTIQDLREMLCDPVRFIANNLE